jgi:hypothetical protein
MSEIIEGGVLMPSEFARVSRWIGCIWIWILRGLGGKEVGARSMLGSSIVGYEKSESAGREG